MEQTYDSLSIIQGIRPRTPNLADPNRPPTTPTLRTHGCIDYGFPIDFGSMYFGFTS
jgi:hypothetical protein